MTHLLYPCFKNLPDIAKTVSSTDGSFSPSDFRKYLSKVARGLLPTEQIAWKSNAKEEARNRIAVLFFES
jgi:hypothetical protein